MTRPPAQHACAGVNALCYHFAMDMDALVTFAQRMEARFRAVDGDILTPRERTYAQLAKLGEEYGELCEQVLAMDGHQRADKADKFGKEKLDGELADVVMVCFILAERLGVNLPEAIGKKVKVVEERFGDA